MFLEKSKINRMDNKLYIFLPSFSKINKIYLKNIITFITESKNEIN